MCEVVALRATSSISLKDSQMRLARTPCLCHELIRVSRDTRLIEGIRFPATISAAFSAPTAWPCSNCLAPAIGIGRSGAEQLCGASIRQRALPQIKAGAIEARSHGCFAGSSGIKSPSPRRFLTSHQWCFVLLLRPEFGGRNGAEVPCWPSMPWASAQNLKHCAAVAFPDTAS